MGRKLLCLDLSISLLFSERLSPCSGRAEFQSSSERKVFAIGV